MNEKMQRELEQQAAVIEQKDAALRIPEAELQPDFCDTHCTWRDHHPDCERAEPVQEPVAWRYKIIPPGWTYSDKKPDKEFAGDAWERWEVTPLYLAPPDQTAEIERLRKTIMFLRSERPLARKLTNYEVRIATLEAEVHNFEIELGDLRDSYDDKKKRIATLEAEVAQWKCNSRENKLIAEQAGAREATLESALRAAKEMVESWSAYASPYFQEKNDLEGDIATINKALGEE